MKPLNNGLQVIKMMLSRILNLSDSSAETKAKHFANWSCLKNQAGSLFKYYFIFFLIKYLWRGGVCSFLCNTYWNSSSWCLFKLFILFLYYLLGCVILANWINIANLKLQHKKIWYMQFNGLLYFIQF